ncbi:hypothetical protein C8R44DRAFT_991173 [Mycena epipterygia]|nr:hypothetical protein C8R44DRAFT_991173 [Mycena epipterygia]
MPGTTWRFETCKSLSVLVFFDRKIDPAHVADISKDFRFILMNMNFLDAVKDWQMGEYTRTDYWSRVEGCIARRRSGEIPGVFVHCPLLHVSQEILD